MPVRVRLRNGKYRVVEGTTGRIVKNSHGTAVDGGGTRFKSRADKQARAINSRLHKK